LNEFDLSEFEMINYLIAGIKRTLGLHRPGRELRILPDDVFLVSYPKSGNTWARLLIANLLSPDKPADFFTINRLVPELEGVTKRQLASMSRPRTIKSHFPFDPRYPRVICIVRDPRDVVISEYHYQRKTRQITDDYPMAQYVPRFIAGRTCPEVGSWGQNVGSWLVARERDSEFLLVRYETLLAETVAELARIADFLGVSATPQRLSEVANLCSADRMRKLEATQSDASSLMKRGRKDVPFVRAAKAGGWKSELDGSLVQQIENAWSPLMQHLGYELSSSSHAPSWNAADFAFSKR
jgi:hypothetical protein